MNDARLEIRLPQDLLDWIDEWRGSWHGKFVVAPSRSEMVRQLIAEKRSERQKEAKI